MQNTTLSMIQEVYFDLCDILDHNELNQKIEGFFEFESLRDFLHEQRQRMAQIETQLDLNKRY